MLQRAIRDDMVQAVLDWFPSSHDLFISTHSLYLHHPGRLHLLILISTFPSESGLRTERCITCSHPKSSSMYPLILTLPLSFTAPMHPLPWCNQSHPKLGYTHFSSLSQQFAFSPLHKRTCIAYNHTHTSTYILYAPRVYTYVHTYKYAYTPYILNTYVYLHRHGWLKGLKLIWHALSFTNTDTE
jgi:hypothetical protein